MANGHRNRGGGLDLENYAVLEKEVGCDDVDKADLGDRSGMANRATGLTGQWAALGCTVLYCAVLGYFGLYWAVSDCSGLYCWAVLGCYGLQ